MPSKTNQLQPYEQGLHLLKFAVAFVLGFSTVFTLLGATASSISNILYEYLDYFRIAAGIIIILFGIHFTHLIQFNFLNKDTRFQIDNFKPGLIGSYIVGISFAFGWTPCIDHYTSYIQSNYSLNFFCD